MNSPAENPLRSIWNAHQRTVLFLQIANRALRQGNIELPGKNAFVGLSQSDIADMTRAAIREAGDHAVIALWTAFERFVIDYVTRSGDALRGRIPVQFHEQLCDHLAKEIERWNFDRILDLFKDIVDTDPRDDLIGAAKQVKRYRDHIAHRNPRRTTPAMITPDEAFGRLSAVMGRIEAATDVH